MQVLEGRLCLEVEGRERVLELEDGEIRAEPWANHRLYPPATGKGDGEAVTRFLLSGGETKEVYRLDTLFFQNWYGYQDEVVMRGAKVDLIQVLCVSGITATTLSLDPSLFSPMRQGMQTQTSHRCSTLGRHTCRSLGGYRLAIACRGQLELLSGDGWGACWGISHFTGSGPPTGSWRARK